MSRKKPKLCKRVREDVKRWDDNWKTNNDQYHEFMAFVMGYQWEEDQAKLFTDNKKTPLTFNKVAPLANSLLGEQRQNTPNLQVQPDDTVPEQTAEIREALIKEITLNSNAKQVYQSAFQQAIIGGFGCYGIRSDYENDYSFDQDIQIYSFKDPTKCFWDPSAESPCKTDGMFAGSRTKMSRKKFKSVYGDALEKLIGSSSSEEQSNLSFSDEDSITIIDYYERDYENATIYQLSTSDVIEQEELDSLERIKLDDETEVLIYKGQPVTIINEREVPRYKVKHYKIAGDYELESSDFTSRQLPIVFVDQNSYWDKTGKQICRPFFKDVRDAQKYLNYLKTQSAYILKISRYDQYLVSKQNVRSADTQAVWRNPAIVLGGLYYDESPNGNKPEQQRPPEISQSLVQQYDSCLMDIQSSTGMYATQLGQNGNEISGDAIDARTERGAYSTYVPFDSLNRAIACGGQIIDEMIPKVYDSKRTMMLHMKDSGVKPVTLNNPIDEYGTGTENDMTKGRYTIRLVPGPSFEGQKAENLKSIQTVLQADPELFRLVADLYVENLPIANNLELRNRLRTIVPPEIIQAGKTGDPIPPKPQQPDPQLMLAMKEMQLKEKDIEIKQQELQRKALETHQDMTIEWEKLNAQKMEAAANLQEMELRYQAEMHRTNTDANISHAQNIIKILTHQPKEKKNVNEERG